VNKQRSIRVMYVAVRAFFSRLLRRDPELLDDGAPYEGDTLLADDLIALRNMEAEVYALNDQFDTEQGFTGAVPS